MMMTPSIDLNVGLISAGVDIESVPAETIVAAPVVPVQTATSDAGSSASAFANLLDDQSAPGKAVGQNTVLGEALQTLIENIDASNPGIEQEPSIPVAVEPSVVMDTDAPVIAETGTPVSSEVVPPATVELPVENAHTDEPVAVQRPVKAETTVIVAAPVTAEASVTTDTDTPVVAEVGTPVSSEVVLTATTQLPGEDAPTDEPVAVQEPVKAEAFVIVATPVTAEPSVTTDADTPVIAETDTPVSSEVILTATTQLPVADVPAEEPVAVQEPVKADTPFIVAAPATAEASVTTDTDTPVVVDVTPAKLPQVQILQESPQQDTTEDTLDVDAPQIADIPQAVDRAFVSNDVVSNPIAAVETTQTVAPTAASAPIDLAANTITQLSPTEQVVSAANAVAETILVTPSLHQGESGEILVQLKPDVLSGSEVRIAVEENTFSVTFVPTTTAVADIVAEHTTDIVTALSNRVPDVTFSVAVAQSVATNVAVASAVAEATYRSPVRKETSRESV